MYSTLALHQLMLSISTQTFQPTHPQTFPESFYQCHLILRKVKVASVVSDFVVLEGRGTDASTLKA